LNTKGAFEGLAAMVQNPQLQKLMTASEPILVVLNGTNEQIHAASRTRITGLIVDAILLGKISRGRAEAQAATFPSAR
jgi:hypothetical protein